MKENKNSNISEYKKRAFSIKLEDPARGFIKANNNLYIVCDDSINLLETGIEKDPENKYPYAPNTTQKILNKGLNSLVIKTIYQYFEAIERGSLKNYHGIIYCNHFDLENVKTKLFEILINLSDFEDTYKEIITSFNNQIINLQNHSSGNNFEIKAFIPNLEKKVKELIVSEAGGLLNKITNLIVIFYYSRLSLNKQKEILQKDKRIFYGIKILQELNLIDEKSELFKYIKSQDSEFLEKFVDIRNALEHGDNSKQVNITNFKIDAERRYIPPMWEIIIKKEKTKNPLIEDLVNYSQKIFKFIDVTIYLLLIEHIESYCFYENEQVYFVKNKEK